MLYGCFSLGAKCVIQAMDHARQKEASHNARLEMLAMQQRFQEQQRF